MNLSFNKLKINIGIGSQGGGLEYVAYAAPVPSAPPMNTSATIIWRVPGYYTWTVPSNITTLLVSLAGGGGGGGGGGYGINCSGAGGSGGGGGASAILINNNLVAIAGGGNSGKGLASISLLYLANTIKGV